MPSKAPLSIDPTLSLAFPCPDGTDNNNVNLKSAWYFYSHLIHRNPKDLKSHTHRIFFAIQNKDPQYISGSLQDLFHVLKGAGESLRIRLLKASLPYLSNEETIHFAMWIKIGFDKELGYKWIPCSILSKGLFSFDYPLVNKTKANTENKISPLEEARSCIEFGQLDVAQSILKEALEAAPSNKQLQEELDYLIEYSKNKNIEPIKEAT